MTDLYLHDKECTLNNRKRLLSNRNLLLWYQELFRHQFDSMGSVDGLAILEIGSGTSPVKLFYGHVKTSDLMDLEHVEHHFDCHKIHEYDRIADKSLDVIIMTNVLHHLADPLAFLRNAASKLKRGGFVVMTEPYFSTLSRMIWNYLHHEPSDFDIAAPRLQDVRGPLSSANMAMPYMIFFTRPDWREPLREHYDFDERSVSYYSALSYMATGGISRKIWMPAFLYKRLLAVDLYLAGKFPRAVSAFFTIRLRRK